MSTLGHYGLTARVLHRLAFRLKVVQDTLADVEQLLWGKRIKSVPLEHPVFITALPRSGTTILLNVLSHSGRFASHTYADMPFLLCPLLWKRFSRLFAQEVNPLERSHGDGIQISTRSPEAFEEVLWKRFWPSHYGADRILPWAKGDHLEEFEEVLALHMRKVIAARQEDSPRPLRYISKNNLNIARVDALPAPMRAGTLLVPFREPLQHAASLLLQHRRFSRIQRDEPFTKEYMDSIGHHEFGLGLRPVDFDSWMSGEMDPEGTEFWVRYWIATYRHVLNHAYTPVHLVSYAHLTTEPISAMRALAPLIDVPEGVLAPLAQHLHPPRTHEVDTAEVSGSILREAEDVYDSLRRRATVVQSD